MVSTGLQHGSAALRKMVVDLLSGGRCCYTLVGGEVARTSCVSVMHWAAGQRIKFPSMVILGCWFGPWD